MAVDIGDGTRTDGKRERPGCISKHVDEGGVDSLRYYLSRKTGFEMLRDRCYDVPEVELERSLSEFRSLFGERPNLQQLSICVSLTNDPLKKILVIFMGPGKIKLDNIHNIHGQLRSDSSLHVLMLILEDNMTYFAEKELKMFPLKVETFLITDLLVNITKHLIQPRWKIINTEEKQSLLKKYSIEDIQLPMILENDALARYYGLERGRVVKLIYEGGDIGPLETYRIVV